MKKPSKKKRNELRIKKEKETKIKKNKELQELQAKRHAEKQKEPKKTKVRICVHFEGHGGGFVMGNAHITLKKISDLKCQCEICKTEFPISYMYTLEKYVNSYAAAGCCDVIDKGRELSKVLKPVRCCLSETGEVSYVDESQSQ